MGKEVNFFKNFSTYSPLCCTKAVKILNVCGLCLFLHMEQWLFRGVWLFHIFKFKKAKLAQMINTW